jgi:hypothetical protein
VAVSRVFWDTNLFIYLFEDAGTLSGRVAGVRQRMLERGDELMTSTLTLGEVRVDLFLTNDERLSTKRVPGIQFIQPVTRAFL